MSRELENVDDKPKKKDPEETPGPIEDAKEDVDRTGKAGRGGDSFGSDRSQ